MKSNVPGVYLICILFLAFARTAFPDSWAGPEEFDAFSENHQYVAHITPATDKQAKPRVDVYAINGKERSKLWSTELSNETSPVRAYVTDNGEYVVTTDNFFGVGYGG